MGFESGEKPTYLAGWLILEIEKLPDSRNLRTLLIGLVLTIRVVMMLTMTTTMTTTTTQNTLQRYLSSYIRYCGSPH